MIQWRVNRACSNPALVRCIDETVCGLHSRTMNAAI
jgi:hypothetical protein